MALHLCLLVGQFVILHLKTEITHRLLDTTIASPHYHLQHAVMVMSLQECWQQIITMFLDDQYMRHYLTVSEALEHLPVILSLQELKFILDSVARFRHSEFKAWLTRLVGRLKDKPSHHITQTRTKFVFQQIQNEARLLSAPAGSTSNISGSWNKGGIFPTVMAGSPVSLKGSLDSRVKSLGSWNKPVSQPAIISLCFNQQYFSGDL